MRIPFHVVFNVHEDGTLQPRQRVRIGATYIGPEWRISKGVYFGDVDLTRHIGRDLEVQQIPNALMVKAVYGS